MKKTKKIILAFVYISSLALFGSTQLAAQSVVAVSQYLNPPWAPPHAAGVRYYYLPDIEAYYDLTDGSFVYLNDGQWIFSPALPALYSGFDLYGAFVVALDVNVYQPWLHHQFYIGHYPPYYYRSRYDKTMRTAIRGFNENAKQVFYRPTTESTVRAEAPRNEAVKEKVESRRPSQEVNYYGRDIGNPVKVTSAMREGGRGGRRG